MPVIWQRDDCPARKTLRTIDGWTIQHNIGGVHVRYPECTAKHRAASLPKMSEDEEKAIKGLGEILRKNAEKERSKDRSP